MAEIDTVKYIDYKNDKYGKHIPAFPYLLSRIELKTKRK